MEAKDAKGLLEAYASVYKNISESHFKVGDEVKFKSNGMEGKVVKVDPEGKGKYYTVKHKDGKTMKHSPDELKKENEGASKEKETEFHDKLDKMVHKTFGKRKEEKAMKEHKVNEARAMSHTGGTPHPLQGDGSKPRGMGGKNFGIEDLPPPTKTKTDKGVKEETDLFDYLLEYLVAEGYADTNKAALVIMANMSEEWKQDIVEGMGLSLGASKLMGKLASNPRTPEAQATKAAQKNITDPIGFAVKDAIKAVLGVGSEKNKQMMQKRLPN
jgi:hypothetical protein